MKSFFLRRLNYHVTGLVVVSILLLISTERAGRCEAETDPASLKGFADTLFQRGHYHPAIMEYERLCYFYPDYAEVPEAHYAIAAALKAVGEYPAALTRFTSLAATYEGSESGIAAWFEGAEVLVLMEDYPAALTQYHAFCARYPHHPLAERARAAIETIAPRVR